MDPVTVAWRNHAAHPGLRDGNVIAWESISEETGTPGRHFLLLEHGVTLLIPPIWVQRGDPIWAVDLVIVQRTGDHYHVIDLDLDVFVPTDGRPYRMLDGDELADAVEAGEFTCEQAMDGLRRWQRFCDTHLHRFGPEDVLPGWRDFPPVSIARLADLPASAFHPVRG